MRNWARVVLAALLLVLFPYAAHATGLTVTDLNASHVIRGVAYSAQIASASGGSGPYSFSLASGSVALPAAMVLQTDGTLSGTTCGSNGNYNLTIQVTDSTSATATGSVQVIVNAAPAGGCALTITQSTLTSGTVGSSYNQTLTTTGGTSPYTYTLASGTLPTGVTLSSSGTLSGTPSASGSYTFSIGVSDSSGTTKTGVQTFSLTINSSAVSLSSPASATTRVGAAYSQTNTGSGGSGSYSYSVSAGALPAGLSLNTSTGVVSGTPTAAGAFSYTIQVSDGSTTATQTVSGTMSAPTITVSPTSLTSGTVGTAFSQTVSASGGTSPYTFSVSAGALPTGLSLNTSTGVVSGTPTAAGTFNFTIQATDSSTGTSAPFSQTRNYSVTIATAALSLSSSASASTQIGVAYSQTNSASGGTGSYTYSVSAGALPAGLSLNTTTGTVSGTPTAAGAFSYTIQVNDGSTTTTHVVSGTIAAATLVISPTTLSNAGVNVSYSQTVTASGGTAPYTYSVSAGSLPTGLSLNTSTGVISGTTSAAATYTFTIQATDSSTGTSAPFSQTRSYSVTISAAALSLSSSASSSTQVGVAYSQTNSASGGTGSYTYSISAGALPAGLTLNTSTGTVSGTPTSSGSFSYTVQVSDGSTTATHVVSGTISASTLSLSPSSLTTPTVGSAYSQTMTASGGTAPYSYAISSGSLPAGLTLNASTGVISGTPTSAASYNFTVTVTDAGSQTANRSFSLTVSAGALSGDNFSVTVPANATSLSIPLAAHATGSPTSATLQSQPSHGTAIVHGLVVIYTPVPGFAGNDSFTYILSNGSVTSSAATITVTNTPLQNPTTDTKVVNIAATQVTATKDFMDTQVSNVTTRMDTMHSGKVGSTNGIRMNRNCQSGHAPSPNGGASMPSECTIESSGFAALQQKLASLFAPSLEEGGTAPQPNIETPIYSVWTAGVLSFGPTSSGKGFFTTSGVSAGIDRHFTSNFLLGVASGIGFGSTKIDDEGSKNDSFNVNGSVYGSYQFYPSLFVDGMLGFGSSSYNMKRYISADNDFVKGTRKGREIFGSIGVSGDIEVDDHFSLSPYTRLDLTQSRLDAYTEQGASASALHYNATSSLSASTAFGVRGYYGMQTEWGSVSPALRLEYRRGFESNQDQKIAYANVTNGDSYSLSMTDNSHNTMLGALGMRIQIDNDKAVEFEYGLQTSDFSIATQQLRASMNFKF